jgi:cytochrome oxidase Cu insertion factor (SCO1/SenC/PrrC family)
MPGMNSGLNINDPTVVAAFKAALLHQGLIALAIFAVLGFAWITIRAWQPVTRTKAPAAAGTTPAAVLPAGESAAVLPAGESAAVLTSEESAAVPPDAETTPATAGTTPVAAETAPATAGTIPAAAPPAAAQTEATPTAAETVPSTADTGREAPAAEPTPVAAAAAPAAVPPAAKTARGAAKTDPAPPEPAWRQLLRIGFGIIWLFDGILQGQAKMAVGLPSQVIEPTAATSPRWVQVVVNWAGTAWSYHPMQAGAAAVWIQVGIGLWLLVAARGPLSRLAGVVSVGWGLVVWVFGEAFGGIFAPGLTWLFGAPGAVLIYVTAGALIALPERTWRSDQIGRLTLAGLGTFLVGMAVLQAWPGRGFWQGTSHGKPGTLAGMTSSMAATRQPHFLSSWINAFTSFDEAHAFAVNLFVVVALAAIGIAFLSGRPRLIRPALAGFVVLCLADWVLIEDIGFLGGLGTDPNSMVPFILLAVAGYLALTRPLAALPTMPDAAASARGWWERLRAAAAPQRLASASLSSVAAIGAIGVIILGTAPLAAAQANPVADTILAQAIDGSNSYWNYAAPGFRLVDQHGRTVTLASLHGKVVLLTFLDPVCTSDCPVEAQEFRQAGQLLGANDSRVELIAIVANPVDTQLGYTRAFDRQEGLSGVPNWLYLTGNLTQLQHVWKSYGIAADILPAGAMIAHTEVAFAIDGRGRVREELNFDPGPATAATQSSFAAELADAARRLLGQS